MPTGFKFLDHREVYDAATKARYAEKLPLSNFGRTAIKRTENVLKAVWVLCGRVRLSERESLSVHIGPESKYHFTLSYQSQGGGFTARCSFYRFPRNHGGYLLSAADIRRIGNSIECKPLCLPLLFRIQV